MTAAELDHAIDRQLAAQGSLTILLRLAEMQQRLAAPTAWQAVVARKEQEIETLRALDVANHTVDCRRLLAAAEPGPAARQLAELLTANQALLEHICALEQQAQQRVILTLANYRSQMAAQQHDAKLRHAYRGRGRAPRFVNQVR